MPDETMELIHEPVTGPHAKELIFKLGYPDDENAQRAYDEADLNRAITAYRFFYPTVSGAAILRGDLDCGLLPNKVFGVMHSGPEQVLYTTNNDTPYGPLLLDLAIGPLVIELAPGPLIVCSMDVNQRWVADMGLPGPDGGKGGKHILVPPGYANDLPLGEGIYVHEASSNLQIVGARALPISGDVEGAKKLLTTIKVYPLDPKVEWGEPKWIDLTGVEQDGTPLAYERDFKFWEVLHTTLDHEPAFEGYHNEYGELAALGIEKGKPFAPNARMKNILTRAAATANDAMRVQSFADRRRDRFPWTDRKWEWASLRYEDGDFNTAFHIDLEAREKWFYQAIGASPAMFRRDEKAGSLYWLGLRDRSGAYLDGGKTYKLSVPLPVPGKLFWSVTVYDTDTRSQIRTDQNKAALRSMFELKGLTGDTAELFFGASAPAGKEGHWIKTIPGKGWFVYFRIYGPQAAAFDGSWKPGDFERID
jgi:hypothetical protein